MYPTYFQMVQQKDFKLYVHTSYTQNYKANVAKCKKLVNPEDILDFFITATFQET